MEEYFAGEKESSIKKAGEIRTMENNNKNRVLMQFECSLACRICPFPGAKCCENTDSVKDLFDSQEE